MLSVGVSSPDAVSCRVCVCVVAEEARVRLQVPHVLGVQAPVEVRHRAAVLLHVSIVT